MSKSQITVRVPSALQPQTDKKAAHDIEASTVGEAVRALVDRFPVIGGKIYHADGKINRWINVFLNDEDIRYSDNEQTVLKSGDEISIVTATAGG